MQVSQYVRKYSSVSSKSGPVPKDKINSTVKWVEYSTDIIKMQSLLLKVSFNEKYALMDALEVAERKKAWHYRQDNFDLKRASYLLQVFKDAE